MSFDWENCLGGHELVRVHERLENYEQTLGRFLAKHPHHRVFVTRDLLLTSSINFSFRDKLTTILDLPVKKWSDTELELAGTQGINPKRERIILDCSDLQDKRQKPVLLLAGAEETDLILEFARMQYTYPFEGRFELDLRRGIRRDMSLIWTTKDTKSNRGQITTLGPLAFLPESQHIGNALMRDFDPDSQASLSTIIHHQLPHALGNLIVNGLDRIAFALCHGQNRKLDTTIENLLNWKGITKVRIQFQTDQINRGPRKKSELVIPVNGGSICYYQDRDLQDIHWGELYKSFLRVEFAWEKSNIDDFLKLPVAKGYDVLPMSPEVAGLSVSFNSNDTRLGDLHTLMQATSEKSLAPKLGHKPSGLSSY